MDKKLSLATILITALGSLSAIESAVAMITKPENSVPAVEYYPPNDPCFDPNKGYLCTPSTSDQQKPQTTESDKSKAEGTNSNNSNFEENNNYPW